MRSTLILVAAAAGLAACGSEPKTATGETGGTLIFATTTDPISILPPFISDNLGRLVADQVFDRLAEIKPELSTIGDQGFSPRLAKSWTWAPDSLSVAFSLDPRARWHDGKPVLANDVRYTFRVFNDPKVGSAVTQLLANIDSVSVRDSLTPVFWFKRRTPEQFFDIAYQLMIMPEHVYGSIPNDQLRTSPAAQAPIGSGRFRLAKWEPGVRLELITDTANFRGRAKLDRVILTPGDPNVAAAKVMSGDADIMEAFPADQLARLDSSTVAGPLPFLTHGYGYMAFNRYAPKSAQTPHPIFSDLRVRRALAMAVDRKAMLQNVFGAQGRLSHGPFATLNPYSDSTLRLPPYDVAAANALLDSAGWVMGADSIRTKNGRKLSFALVTPVTSLFRTNYAVLMQEQFKRVGAHVEVDKIEGAKFGPRLTTGDWDAIMAAYTPDPGPGGMKQSWTTAGIGYVNGQGVTGQNWVRYSNPRVDAALDSAMHSFDFERSRAHTARASQMIVDDVPAIFLYDQVMTHALNRRFVPATTRADGWWSDLADWTVAPAKRIDRDQLPLSASNP
jgi:peptide/nickel transport system substrate-binding protein